MNFSLFGDDDAMPPDTADLLASDAPVRDAPPAKDLAILRGHDLALAHLWGAWRAGRFPHGLILSGPEGIGKYLLARHIAAFVLDQPHRDSDDPAPFAASPAVRSKIALGSHPDALIIQKIFDDDKGRFKPNLLVEQIRTVPAFLQKTASVANGWRVVIIDDADTMNRSAQNALLKILEEPPPRTLLILIAHRSGSFLPTVRSRCHVVPMTLLPEPLFARALRDHGLDRSPLLIKLFPGQPGRVADHLESGAEQVWLLMDDLCAEWPRLDPVAVHLFAERLAPADQDSAFRFLVFMILAGFAAVIRAKATGRALDEPWRTNPLWTRCYETHDVSALFVLRDRIETAANRTLDQSLDRKTFLLQIFVFLKQG